MAEEIQAIIDAQAEAAYAEMLAQKQAQIDAAYAAYEQAIAELERTEQLRLQGM